MDDQIKNKEQITAIKERLNRYKEEAGLTLGALTEKINQETDIEVNYNTLRSTLDYSKDVINTFVVIGVCRCLGKDIAMTLSPPCTKDTTLQNAPNDFLGTGKFVVLDDSKYFYKFYGYFPAGNQKLEKLIPFTLEICKTDDSVKATLNQYKTGSYKVSENKHPAESFSGTPYLDTTHSDIFILLTNDTGGFYFLYMDKPPSYSSHPYFSRGIALRPAVHGSHPICFMNFMLLKYPIAKEKERCVAGMLAEISPSFQIDEDSMMELCVSEPLVNTFYEEFGYLLKHDKQWVYTINESAVLSCSSKTMTQDQVIRAMMLIKDASYAAKKIKYDEPAAYYNFARHYLLKQNFHKNE